MRWWSKSSAACSERFHRVYRGEHIRTRNKVILHLYDLSDCDDAKPDRLASGEFEALQKLQHLACVPRLIDSFHEVPEYPGELCFFSLVDPCAPTLAERSGDAGWTVTARCEFAARALKSLAQIHDNDRDGVDLPKDCVRWVKSGTDGLSQNRFLGIRPQA